MVREYTGASYRRAASLKRSQLRRAQVWVVREVVLGGGRSMRERLLDAVLVLSARRLTAASARSHLDAR